MPLISERSRKQVRLLLLLLVVLGAGALYTYVFVPQAERLDRAKADLQDAEMQLQMSLAKLARANQAQIDLEDAVLRLDAACARIPETPAQATCCATWRSWPKRRCCGFQRQLR